MLPKTTTTTPSTDLTNLQNGDPKSIIHLTKDMNKLVWIDSGKSRYQERPKVVLENEVLKYFGITWVIWDTMLTQYHDGHFMKKRHLETKPETT